jgi:DNA-binding FadR family transcriptional regulator
MFAVHRISQDIVERGLRPGDRIGSEPELMVRYSVGRPVLREALRVLEHEGRATSRRGPAGGIYVTRPESSVVTRSIAVWLSDHDATVEQLYEVREFIEGRAAEWATAHIDEDGARLLVDMLRTEARLLGSESTEEYARQALDFHAEVARLSENPVAELLVRSLGRLVADNAGDVRYSPAEMESEWHAHQRIADAIIAGDGPLASHRMTRHVRAAFALEAEYSRTGRPVLHPDVARDASVSQSAPFQ